MLKISIETLNKRTYEKVTFYHLLMVFSFATIANAKKPKEKVSWPKAVLTLKDGTVLNGYLQNDIHFMKKTSISVKHKW